MALTDLLTTLSIQPGPGPKPKDSDLDLFGLTHPGKERKENQDHFLVCTIHQQVVVHATSFPDPTALPLRSERLGTLLLVADGVGGGRGGREASQLALEAITRYTSSTMRCFHAMGRGAEKEFYQALREAAGEAHQAVRDRAREVADARGMATTLTLALAVWPKMYVLQVGDSRCYHYDEGRLRQVTRDQTVAQNLVDKGALSAEHLATSPLSHVLASSIGGNEAAPEVSRFDLTRTCIVLLCTDGLTKHVSDAEIGEHLRTMRSAEQTCRALLGLALERGGSDNVTVLIGTARARSGS
jgi:protein phosphatase